MDDRRAQFLIAVGDLCGAARLAGLVVEVRLGGHGDLVRGVPRSHPAADEDDEVDDTGYTHALIVDDRIIDLETVEACMIFAPSDQPRR
jgi:hypothetical protein